MSIFEYDAERHMAHEKEESREEERINLIKKKILKLKSIEVIADELECEPEEIRKLYDGVRKCGVDG